MHLGMSIPAPCNFAFSHLLLTRRDQLCQISRKREVACFALQEHILILNLQKHSCYLVPPGNKPTQLQAPAVTSPCKSPPHPSCPHSLSSLLNNLKFFASFLI